MKGRRKNSAIGKDKNGKKASGPKNVNKSRRRQKGGRVNNKIAGKKLRPSPGENRPTGKTLPNKRHTSQSGT